MRTLYESILDSDEQRKEHISIMTDRYKQRYAVMNIFKKYFTIKSNINYKGCAIKRTNYNTIKEFVDELKELPFINRVDMDGTKETPCSDPRLSCIVTVYDTKNWSFHFSFNKVQNCVLYMIDTSDFRCKLTDYLDDQYIWHK